MRDLYLVLVVALMAPLALRFPFVGVYAWEWLSLMNPHRMVYSFAQDQPFNMIIAIITLVGWAFSSQPQRVKITGFVVLLGLFTAWVSLTTFMAPTPEATTPLWIRQMKTTMLMVAILAMINNRVRLQGLVWIVAISLAYFGVRGAGFMLLTGGKYIVFGPTQSMIEDNNSLALALIITLPLINYLRQQAEKPWLRFALLAAMGMVGISVLGSYSRGGFVALGAMLAFLWLKSRGKIVTGILAVVGLAAALLMMPQKYFDRLGTMENLQADSSFQGRLDAWEVAWDVALHRPLGAGFDGPRQEVIWNQYLPGKENRASHSIYFMVLGEHGFVGLGLYLALCFAAWRNLARVIKLTKNKDELKWARELATAFQIAMIGFLVGGAALPMAYYDGFLTILAMSVPLRRLTEESADPVEIMSFAQRLRGLTPRRLANPPVAARGEI